MTGRVRAKSEGTTVVPTLAGQSKAQMHRLTEYLKMKDQLWEAANPTRTAFPSPAAQKPPYVVRPEKVALASGALGNVRLE